MTFEQFIQTKSKEEIAFIFYNYGDYKNCNCMLCQFFQADNFGVRKCRSFFHDKCREEYYEWIKKEI